MGTFFSATLSNPCKIVTVAITILLVGVGAWMLYLLAAAPQMSQGRQLVLLGVTALVFGILGIAFLFSPTGYYVEPDKVRVRRRLGEKTLPLAGLAQVRILLPQEMKGALRLCGNGGMGGFWGYYWSSRLGRFRAYCANLSRCVLLQYQDGQKVVVSPDETERFCAMVGRAGGLGGQGQGAGA